MFQLLPLFFCLVFLFSTLSADDEPEYNEVVTKVDENTIPSLVNLTSMPSAVVGGCVHVITGDFCEADQEDVVSGPDPYVLGHSYCSSSLDEGSLGDGWNFLHAHKLEVYQSPRIKYVYGKSEGSPLFAILMPDSSSDETDDDDSDDIAQSDQELLFLSQDSQVSESVFDSDNDDSDDSIIESRCLFNVPLFDAGPIMTRESPSGLETGPLERPLESPLERLKLEEGRACDHPKIFDYGGGGSYKPTKTPKTPLFVSVFDPSGGRLLFRTIFDNNHKSRSMRHFKLVTKKTGFTNVSGGQISGQTNIKNTTLTWDKESDCFTVTLGDGTKRVYEPQKHAKISSKKRIYRLHKEVQPSGNIIVFDYNSEDELTQVRAYNKDLSHKLYNVEFEQKSSGAFSKNPSLHVTTSDGLEHVYYFKKLKGSYMDGTYSVSGIKRQGFGYTRYLYCKKSPRHKRRVVRKEYEDGSFIEVKYYRPSDNLVGDEKVKAKSEKRRKFLRNRVRELWAPVGPSSEKVLTHRFFYYKRENGTGYAKVLDFYGMCTRYYWDRHKRLVCVTKRDPDKHFLMKEHYTWGKEGSNDEGRLMCRILYDEDKKPKLARVFSYDSRGNIIKDKYYGRFTENSHSLRIEKGFPVSTSAETIATKYTYSDDGYNLKASECDPKKNYTYYKYKKGTNLLKAKYSCEGKKIKKREFFSYDKSANLVEHIVDDGSKEDKNDLAHATERHITKITLRNERPHFGEAKIIEEYFYDFDKKEQILLKKTHNHFSKHGFVTKKTIYDQNNDAVNYRYTYDEIGRLLSSQDPQGKIHVFSYDTQGRMISKKGPRDDVSWQYVYDLAGRLVKEIETHDDGLQLVTRNSYDCLGRKTVVQDPQGNETRYAYDFLNRVVKIDFPSSFDHEGKLVSSKKKFVYEALGTKVTRFDQNEYLTVTTYNALGQVVKEIFPDKTERRCFYDKKGCLIKEIAPNLAVTHNEYDSFNRCIKSTISKEKTVLGQHECVFNTFHLVKEIGPTGQTRSFDYDFAGRKRSETLSGSNKEVRTKTFYYDAKSRLSKERVEVDTGRYIHKVYVYNDFDELVEEQILDNNALVYFKKYSYDLEGNCASITQNIDGEKAVQSMHYYPHKKLKSICDAQKNKTEYFYDYYYTNEYGQCVLCKDVVDARGVVQKLIYDPRNNLCEEKRLDPSGNTISKKNLFYDGANNLVRIQETAYVNNQAGKTHTTTLTYGPKNRLEAITLAAGTENETSTNFVYNKYGQKETVLFNDRVLLHHRYDSKGRLLRCFSSDSTIDYTYRYDNADRIVEVHNGITHANTLRRYNDFGEVVLEELETGHKMRYSYDPTGRISKISLPDASSIHYSYTPAYVHTIERRDAFANTCYVHTIQDRDLSGYIKRAQLCKNAKTIEYSRDLLGRCVHIQHPTFEEHAESFDPVGNLLQLTTHDPQGEFQRTFSYDFLSQLTQESGFVHNSYCYDSLYNRLSHNDIPYELNALHATVSDGMQTFDYDKRGNRILTKGLDNVAYKYDALDRLIEVQKEHVRYLYSYDAFNRRVERQVYDGQKHISSTQYLYALDNEIGAMAGDVITELRVLGVGLGAEIGASVAIEFDEKVFVPIHDRQGNVCMLLNEEGTPVQSYRYDAFGNEYLPATQYVDNPYIHNPWRFSSKRTDEETGFVYFGRRFYDPAIGKWLTLDPLGLNAGPNLYAYLYNSPLTRFDAYGLYVETEETKWRPYACKNPQIRNAYRTRIENTYRDLGYKTRPDGIFQQNHKHYTAVPLIERPKLDNATILYVSGMNTPFVNAVEQAMYISDTIGGYEVSIIQNFSYSPAVDAVRAVGESMMLIETEAVKDLKRTLEEALFEHGAGHKFFIVGFSEGAIITGNALDSVAPEVKGAAHALGICPGRPIPDGIAEKTENVINKNPVRDFVPYLYEMGRSAIMPESHKEPDLNRCFDYNKTLVESHPDAPFFDHDVTSPTYKGQIKDNFDDFRKSLGQL